MKFVQRSGYIVMGFYGLWVWSMPEGRQNQWDIQRLENQGRSVLAASSQSVGNHPTVKTLFFSKGKHFKLTADPKTIHIPNVFMVFLSGFK